MVRRQLMVAIAVLAVAAATLAQEKEIKRLDGSSIKPAAIDETVRKLMVAAEVPGVGLALFNDGKIVYLKAYGERDKEKNLPLTVDSIMSGASFSKVVFGYLVLQLADKRTLDLDKPVYEYLPKPLPEYANYSDLAGDPRYKRITARMLRTFCSGLAGPGSMDGAGKLKITP